MLYTSPFGERVFVQLQPDLLSILNSGGTWNPSGAQYVRISNDSLKIQPDEPKIAPNIKHGSASQLARISGRKSATWSLNAPLAPSGTQAVPPDIDPMLQSIFGKAGALATGTLFGNAWIYTIADRVAKPMTILGFQHGQSTFGNRYILGAIPTGFSVDFNGNILGASIRGVGVAAVENESFGFLPENLPYGGLSGFPPEPNSFTINGNLINAFSGTLFINGVPISNQCDSFSFEFETGQGLKGDFIDNVYPGAPIFTGRSANVSMGFANNDSAILATLKKNARTNALNTVAFYLGSVPGYRMFIQVNGVQLIPASLSDSQGYVSCSFGNSASSVSAGSADDFYMGFA
jgi:hypothetical protein